MYETLESSYHERPHFAKLRLFIILCVCNCVSCQARFCIRNEPAYCALRRLIRKLFLSIQLHLYNVVDLLSSRAPYKTKMGRCYEMLVREIGANFACSCTHAAMSSLAQNISLTPSFLILTLDFFPRVGFSVDTTLVLWLPLPLPNYSNFLQVSEKWF